MKYGKLTIQARVKYIEARLKMLAATIQEQQLEIEATTQSFRELANEKTDLQEILQLIESKEPVTEEQ